MSEGKDRPRETSDPFAWWREWLVQSERQWNAALNEMMGSEQFSQSMGRWMEVYLGVQKNVNETLGRALAGLNVPNRDDVAELGRRLAAIEERLARMETWIERGTGVAAQLPQRRRPPRTRRPPAQAQSAAGAAAPSSTVEGKASGEKKPSGEKKLREKKPSGETAPGRAAKPTS